MDPNSVQQEHVLQAQQVPSQHQQDLVDHQQLQVIPIGNNVQHLVNPHGLGGPYLQSK